MNISREYLTGSQLPGIGPAAGTASESGVQGFGYALAELIALRRNGMSTPACMSEEEKDTLLQQLKDPNGDFYRDMRLAAWRAAREKEEDEEEQEVIDALMQIIDNVTGQAQRERQGRSDWAGVELGQLEKMDPNDPHEVKSAQMLAYLASLGDKGTFQLGEDEESSEAEKIRESGEDAVQRTMTEDQIAALAKQYDPHHMEQEEFVDFMNTLAAEGALAPEDAEGIKNTGKWKVTVTSWSLEDGNGQVIDSGTNWTPPRRMDEIRYSNTMADRWLLPCLYDGGEDDGDVLVWARLGCQGAYSDGYQTLVDILTHMEGIRAEETADS